jgi:hypothetical protein
VCVPNRAVSQPLRRTNLGTAKGPAMKYTCSGPHRYFIAETVGVESEGTVSVIAVCTDCGDCIFHKFQVAGADKNLTLARNENV